MKIAPNTKTLQVSDEGRAAPPPFDAARAQNKATGGRPDRSLRTGFDPEHPAMDVNPGMYGFALTSDEVQNLAIHFAGQPATFPNGDLAVQPQMTPAQKNARQRYALYLKMYPS